MIAQEIVAVLVDAGAEVLGPVSRLANAARLVASEMRIDGALLDVNLGNEVVWPVVETLLARDVPLVLATGYDASAIPNVYSHLPHCEKPASGQGLARALAQIVRAPIPDPS